MLIIFNSAFSSTLLKSSTYSSASPDWFNYPAHSHRGRHCINRCFERYVDSHKLITLQVVELIAEQVHEKQQKLRANNQKV